MGRIEIPDLELITSEPWLVWQLISTRAKWRSSLSGWSSVEKKVLDNAGIVRDACFRQSTEFCRENSLILTVPVA
jgi:hypothetical protein